VSIIKSRGACEDLELEELEVFERKMVSEASIVNLDRVRDSELSIGVDTPQVERVRSFTPTASTVQRM